jgi:hypothetical protein
MLRLYREFTTQEEIDAQYRVTSSAEALLRARTRAETLSAEVRQSFRI